MRLINLEALSFQRAKEVEEENQIRALEMSTVSSTIHVVISNIIHA